jgi:carboxymethylenebutenolidase
MPLEISISGRAALGSGRLFLRTERCTKDHISGLPSRARENHSLAKVILIAMKGEMISFECDGDSYRGYLSKSESGTGPAVVVIQEYWGLVGHIKDVADRFAAEGFTALAPDFYKGEVATEPEEAGKLMMALNISETEKILRCAIRRLLADPAVGSKKAGVVGFCMGGQLSLFAATTNDEIAACVDFYGIHPNVQPKFQQLRGPVLGFFAEHDEYASPAAVAALDEQLTAAGKEHDFTTFPGTPHAFFNDQRPEVYDEAASKQAWAKMVAFFRENVK